MNGLHGINMCHMGDSCFCFYPKPCERECLVRNPRIRTGELRVGINPYSSCFQCLLNSVQKSLLQKVDRSIFEPRKNKFMPPFPPRLVVVVRNKNLILGSAVFHLFFFYCGWLVGQQCSNQEQIRTALITTILNLFLPYTPLFDHNNSAYSQCGHCTWVCAICK
jgi:hypothetical protein